MPWVPAAAGAGVTTLRGNDGMGQVALPVNQQAEIENLKCKSKIETLRFQIPSRSSKMQIGDRKSEI
jgi:hypothetical protein